ncbi:MAG TPA: proton-conducting transporter membrane subunit, partial [bacterium]
MMLVLLGALALELVGGVAAIWLQRKPRVALRVGFGATLVGCVIGLVPVVQTLLGNSLLSFRRPWSVPYGEFYLELDALSALFLFAILGLAGVAALYGSEYLEAYQNRKPLGATIFFFNLMVAAMAVVVMARNGMLFLVAWEIMSLASYFLLTFEDEKPEVCEAGLTYLIATHLGAAFLFAMFVLAARETGSLNFDQFHLLAAASPTTSSVLFVLAVIGFGAKAGFVPFHVWLPEAHPAAPSHVSALMSGVMIKTGIYGILRLLTYLGPPPAWWGILLLIIGALSGILGILYALAQRDLKRLLAYSSVENIGVIGLGIGVGLLGQASGQLLVSAAGYAGALFHILNHALFKGLLFLGAGSVLHATTTRNMEKLGGLLKTMPRAGILFLLGSVAICALPPMNGFVSEWFIYNGMLRGGFAITGSIGLLLVFSAVGLAFIGSLALAAFSKAFAIVFLGEPRSQYARRPHDAGARMNTAMTLLAAGCILAGLYPSLVMKLILPGV